MNVIATTGLLAAMSLSLHGQEYVRWVKDLGDQERSEAAERKLLAMGDKVLRPLEEQLQQWGPDMGEERCLALLRIIRLLGHRAEPLAGSLKTCITDWSGKFLPEAVQALASLEPWAGDNEWHTLFHQSIGGSVEQKGLAFAAFARLTSRQALRQRDTLEQLQVELKKDRFATRAAAAEMMGKLGDKAAVDLLHKRLLDRETKPKNWDQLRHNGFVIPMEDEFGLQAGLAMIKLAPSDPRTAVGYANVALHHPHASVRLEMIRQMAQLGPAAADAIPELMLLARSSDSKIATEALKLLGMAGSNVGEHLSEIRRLAKRDTGAAANIANSLAKRLVAMGAKEAAAPQPDEGRKKLTQQISKLDDKTADEVRSELAANPLAWELLLERFRKELRETPDVVFDVLARAAWSRSEKERQDLIYCVAGLGGDTWHANMMSSSSGGSSLTATHKMTYARLHVDPSLDLQQLSDLLEDDNGLVRLVAIQVLTERAQEWAGGTDKHVELRDRLLKAATSKHPAKMKLQIAKNHTSSTQVNTTRMVRIAAAESLADFVLPADKSGPLLKTILRGKDEKLIVKAIAKWGRDDSRKELEAAANDNRESVAAAAKAALERLAGQ